MRNSFTLFGITIYYYGVLIAAGALLAMLLAERRQKPCGLPKDTAIDILLLAMPVGLIGARLYYILLTRMPLRSFLDFRSGGLAIYGGLILGGLSGFLYAKKRRLSFLTVCDAFAPGVALAQGIGRWGNFFNQEAHGFAITDPRLEWFPLAVWIERENGWFAATFFYESVCCFAVCALLLALSRRLLPRRGASALFYCVCYCAERCVVEGMRTDSLYLLGFRASQILSAAVLIAAGIFLLMMNKSAKPLGCFALSIVALAYGILTENLWITALGATLLCAINLSLLFSNRTSRPGTGS